MTGLCLIDDITYTNIIHQFKERTLVLFSKGLVMQTLYFHKGTCYIKYQARESGLGSFTISARNVRIRPLLSIDQTVSQLSAEIMDLIQSED